MKLTIHPGMQHLRPFVERLPEVFASSADVLHDGRNQIRAFEIEGERYAVKRYKRPNAFNTFIYTFFRRCKAQRAYEHALKLLEMGIDTPSPVAWSQYRRNGLIGDTYYICRYSEYVSLAEATKRFPAPQTLPVLDAFARFAAQLHEKGVLHEDFNQTNTLWAQDTETGGCRFQLIDINRMKFHTRPLRPEECMINLRRLSCPAGAFLYVLDRYAEARAWNIDDTLLRGTFFRLLFRRRQQFKRRLREHKQAPAGKK